MSKKDKSLCKWKKDEIEDSFKEYASVVSKAEYVCLKCGRASSKKKLLCKPKAI